MNKKMHKHNIFGFPNIYKEKRLVFNAPEKPKTTEKKEAPKTAEAKEEAKTPETPQELKTKIDSKFNELENKLKTIINGKDKYTKAFYDKANEIMGQLNAMKEELRSIQTNKENLEKFKTVLTNIDALDTADASELEEKNKAIKTEIEKGRIALEAKNNEFNENRIKEKVIEMLGISDLDEAQKNTYLNQIDIDAIVSEAGEIIKSYEDGYDNFDTSLDFTTITPESITDLTEALNGLTFPDMISQESLAAISAIQEDIASGKLVELLGGNPPYTKEEIQAALHPREGEEPTEKSQEIREKLLKLQSEGKIQLEISGMTDGSDFSETHDDAWYKNKKDAFDKLKKLAENNPDLLDTEETKKIDAFNEATDKNKFIKENPDFLKAGGLFDKALAVERAGNALGGMDKLDDKSTFSHVASTEKGESFKGVDIKVSINPPKKPDEKSNHTETPAKTDPEKVEEKEDPAAEEKPKDAKQKQEEQAYANLNGHTIEFKGRKYALERDGNKLTIVKKADRVGASMYGVGGSIPTSLDENIGAITLDYDPESNEWKANGKTLTVATLSNLEPLIKEAADIKLANEEGSQKIEEAEENEKRANEEQKFLNENFRNKSIQAENGKTVSLNAGAVKSENHTAIISLNCEGTTAQGQIIFAPDGKWTLTLIIPDGNGSKWNAHGKIGIISDDVKDIKNISNAFAELVDVKEKKANEEKLYTDINGKSFTMDGATYTVKQSAQNSQFIITNADGGHEGYVSAKLNKEDGSAELTVKVGDKNKSVKIENSKLGSASQSIETAFKELTDQTKEENKEAEGEPTS